MNYLGSQIKNVNQQEYSNIPINKNDNELIMSQIPHSIDMKPIMLYLLLFIFSTACAQEQYQRELPNPLLFNDHKSKVTNMVQWDERRKEISEMIQQHEIGTIPSVSHNQIKARMEGDTLYVTVFVGKDSLVLSSQILPGKK